MEASAISHSEEPTALFPEALAWLSGALALSYLATDRPAYAIASIAAHEVGRRREGGSSKTDAQISAALQSAALAKEGLYAWILPAIFVTRLAEPLENGFDTASPLALRSLLLGADALFRKR